MQKLLKGSNFTIGAIVLIFIALVIYIITPTSGYQRDESQLPPSEADGVHLSGLN